MSEKAGTRHGAARAARDAWDERGRRNELLPPECFDNDLARREEYFDQSVRGEHPAPPRTGAESPALAGVIYSRCRGWKKPPTAKELYDAFRSKALTQRELALLGTWFREATVGELTEAHAQQAYTDRELVRALHAIGFSRTEEPWAAHRIRLINSRAVR